MTTVPVIADGIPRALTHPPGRRLRRSLLIIGFLAPAAILFLGFVVWPIGQALVLGLFQWDGLGPPHEVVGLENYQSALTDPVFLGAIGHTLFFIVTSVVLQLPVALGLALLVRRNLIGSHIFRLIFFLPFVLSDVVAAQIWNFLYQPQFGGIDAIFAATIPGFESQDWLGNGDLVLWAIFAVSTWKYLGFSMTLFITGLNQIPAEVEEAAMLDGASAFQTFWFVTLPMIGSTVRLAIYLAVLGSLQMFELIFVMSGGGPAHASETITTYMYNYGFKSFQLGYGNALAVILFLVCFGFSFFYQRFVFRRDFAGEVARG